MQESILRGAMLSFMEYSGLTRLLIGALIGAVVGGPAAYFIPQFWSKGSADQHSSEALSGGGENKMGNVSGNQGIVTQGQKGDNKISK
jgi:hypothetical protein